MSYYVEMMEKSPFREGWEWHCGDEYIEGYGTEDEHYRIIGSDDDQNLGMIATIAKRDGYIPLPSSDQWWERIDFNDSIEVSWYGSGQTLRLFWKKVGKGVGAIFANSLQELLCLFVHWQKGYRWDGEKWMTEKKKN